MRNSFHTHRFEDKLDLLSQATNWLSSLGLSYDRSRIGQYLKDIDFMLKAIKENRVNLLTTEEFFPKITNSLYEADEIIQIWEGLSTLAISKNLTDKLNLLLKGPSDISDESLKTNTNIARNISFELFMISLFANSGYELDLRTETDLIIVDPRFNLFIECKRLNGIKSLGSNVGEAAKQLKRRYNLLNYSSPKYGIIALSIEKIVNPNHYLLETADEHAIDREIEKMVRQFINSYKIYWQKINDTRTIGVLILFKTIAIHAGRNILTTCRYIAANNICKPGSMEIEILKEVTNKLSEKILRK